ncbi:hypothetical protein GLO73106DRAFT_00022220 [Gloeocapsa sp. PCC 73106]|nr:hypothetical protein GLO73106DRAFT_00022220 [Gloeocapsa sp. PCC 73106]
MWDLSNLETKMREYLDSGLRLGWLINPQNQQVIIYRPSQNPAIFDLPTVLEGETVLIGFKLYLSQF